MRQPHPTIHRRRTRRRIPLTTFGILFAALLTTGATPASDGTELDFTSIQDPIALTTTTAGEIAFEGQATLPTFPCEQAPPYGDGAPCTGTFEGQWAGQIVGLTSGIVPFEATWTSASDGVEATFLYNEFLCGAGGVATVLGQAVGEGFAESKPGEVDGRWIVPGETFPRTINGVRLSFGFEWARAVTTAVLLLQPSTLEINVSGLGWVTVAAGDQVATATFVPTEEDNPGGVPSCDSPITNIQGEIVGTLPITNG